MWRWGKSAQQVACRRARHLSAELPGDASSLSDSMPRRRCGRGRGRGSSGRARARLATCPPAGCCCCCCVDSAVASVAGAGHCRLTAAATAAVLRPPPLALAAALWACRSASVPLRPALISLPRRWAHLRALRDARGQRGGEFSRGHLGGGGRRAASVDGAGTYCIGSRSHHRPSPIQVANSQRCSRLGIRCTTLPERHPPHRGTAPRS